MVKVAADTKSGSWPPASTLMQQHRQQHSCAHVVQYIPVHPKQARSPHTRPSLSPTIWHTHRTDGQVGRRRQAAGCQLTLSGRRSPSNWRKRFISALSVSEASVKQQQQPPSAAPHLSLPSTVPARRRSITVERTHPKRKPFPPPRREKVCGNDSLELPFGPESTPPLPLLFRRRI